MMTLFKLIRGLVKAITSSAAPWQVAVGALLGVLLGFLPIFPHGFGPSPLAFMLIFAAIVINCHLGSVLVFLLVGKLLSVFLLNPAVALGNQCDWLAQICAEIPLLHASMWSHTGYLGLTLIGLIAAPVIAIGMLVFTIWFRAAVQHKLAERRKLMAAGKVMGNTFVFKAMCWFLGLG